MPLDFILIALLAMLSFISLINLLGNVKKIKQEDPVPRRSYDISVIIPMLNEENSIADTLKSVIKMLKKNKGKYEIIVIDDNSNDNSYKIVKEMSKKYNFIRLYKKKGKRGKANSLNQGIKLAKYEIIATVDADSYPDENTLKYSLGYFDDSKVGVVTVKLKAKEANSILERFQKIDYIINNFFINASDFFDAIPISKGALSLFRKDILQRIGGFKEILTEDFEIIFRIVKAGYKIRSSKKAFVYTKALKNIKSLFWQRVRWYRGSIQTYLMHKDVLFNKKYGLFGLLIIPIMVIIVLLSFISFSYFLKMIFKKTSLLYIKYKLGILSFSFNLTETINNIGRFLIFKIPYMLPLLIFDFVLAVINIIIAFKESEERFSLKDIFALIIMPFIYFPLYLYFWIAAIFFEIIGYKKRWR